MSWHPVEKLIREQGGERRTKRYKEGRKERREDTKKTEERKKEKEYQCYGQETKSRECFSFLSNIVPIYPTLGCLLLDYMCHI